MKNQKKGQLGNLSALTISLVSIGILLIVSFLIMAQVATNTQVAADNNATAAVQEVQTAMDDIPTWLPIIVVVVIGSLLLGLISLFRGRA